MLRALLVVLCSAPSVALAGGHRGTIPIAATSVVTIPAGFVAVPFAVPVAMPSYVQYQSLEAVYSVAAGHATAAVVGGSRQRPAPYPESEAAVDEPSKKVSPAATTLVAVHCGNCHGAVKPKAGLDLTGPLADATRLNAITRLLADDPEKRMPRGKEIPPQLLGELIQELSLSDASRESPKSKGARDHDASIDGSRATERPAPHPDGS